MSTTITELLVHYWQMADEHKASLDAHRDEYGEPDADDLPDYDDARATAAIEASDFLDSVMEELAALYPLPLGRQITVSGASGEQFAVTTGQLDDTARDAFTSGQCHALARALSTATGWPMAVIISDACSEDANTCSAGDDAYAGLCACRFDHVVVVRPDGALIDVRGAHRPGEVPFFERQKSIELTEEGWSFLCSSPRWRRPALAVARTFTAPVLALIAATEPAGH